MDPPPFSYNNAGGSRPRGQEILEDHRARVKREAEEREQRRQLQLNEQRASTNSSSARIRAWEKAHGLRLPASPNHPILRVIAIATALSLDDVREEQRARQSATES
jgi:hypothetical protein